MGKKTINSFVKQIMLSKSCNMKSTFKKYNEIGAGEYGKVYKACINDKCLNKIAVKNSTANMSAEFLISRKLAKLGVPQVYGYEKCSNRDLLFSEFINGVTLRDYLSKKSKKMVDDGELKSIISQMVYILYTIHREFPTFRHHDLHLDNIMIMKKRISTDREIKVGNTTIEFNDAKLEVKLMDFGLSTERGVINPIVRRSTSFKKDYGIFEESDKGYDLHLFLTSLYGSKSAVGVKKLIESLFNKAYLEKESDVTKEFRLRSDVIHELPTYEEVLSHSYFSKPKNSVKKFVNKLPAPPKTISIQAIKAKTPENKDKAKLKAMNTLKKLANAKKVPTKAVIKKVPTKKPTLMKSPAKPLTLRGN